MLTSDTAILNQYQKDGKRSFFKALEKGEFSKALEIMDTFKIDPDTKGGLLSAPALFYVVYVANAGNLEPSLTETLLKKGANPNLKDTGFVEKKTVLEEVIHTGFYYYTHWRMNHENNLESNLLKTIELLAASGGTCREDLFEILQKSPVVYDERRNYTEFKESILKAIKQGQATFEKRQEEKRITNGAEYSGGDDKLQFKL